MEQNPKYVWYGNYRYGFQQGYYRRIVQLHRQVWEDNFGSIPEGHQIHHKNGNTADNRLENLECLSVSAHRSHHNKQKEIHYQKCKIGSRISERKKRVWNLLKEGKTVTSENSLLFWNNRKNEGILCVICGKEFWSRSVKIKNRCCSNACRCYLYRLKKRGLYNDVVPTIK